jgi:hypothetical protein
MGSRLPTAADVNGTCMLKPTAAVGGDVSEYDGVCANVLYLPVETGIGVLQNHELHRLWG